MTDEQRVPILRQIYFGQIIEAMKNYEKHGIREAVIADKKARDLAEGPAKCVMFGLKQPEDFLRFSQDAFNCVDWNFEQRDEGFTATTQSCVACHMAKEAGSPSICEMHCINPFLSVVKGLHSENELTVEETLWEGNACIFHVKK